MPETKQNPVGTRRELFSDIIGYDDLKEIIIDAIKNKAKVNWLFYGPPASAKTMFLMEMEEKLPGAKLIVGSRLSKPGLHDMILKLKPKFIIFDELDKAPETALTSLLVLLETGRIVVTLKSYQIDEYIDTVMFATANRLDRVPPEVLSRFQLLEFPEYTKKEFMNICRGYIANREDVTIELAEYIGERVWNHMNIRDVRQVVRIARLAKTKEKANLMISVFSKYRGISSFVCRDCGRGFSSNFGLIMHLSWSKRRGSCKK